jgi:hypothetical protein
VSQFRIGILFTDVRENMKKIKLLHQALCFFLIFGALSNARAEDLAGRVFDSQGAPVAAARVSGVLPTSQITAATNADGGFVLRNLPTGFVGVIALHPTKGAIATRQISGGADVELRLVPYSTPFTHDVARAEKILTELSLWSSGAKYLDTNALWAPLATYDLERAVQRSRLTDGSLPDAFISRVIAILGKTDPALAARWGVEKLDDIKEQMTHNFTAALLAGKLVQSDPQLANALYERATLVSSEYDNFWTDGALWQLAFQLKRPEAEALLESALKKAREADAEPEEEEEEWRSEHSAQAYLIGELAKWDLPRAERLLEELPAELRADARSLVVGVLTARGGREDLQKARGLLEAIASDAAPQARRYFAPSAIKVLLAIGQNDPAGALAIARRVTESAARPEALAAAAQFQDDAVAGVLLREAAQAAREHPFPIGQMVNIAAVAERRFPDFARELGQQALAMWQSFPAKHAAWWREDSGQKLADWLAHTDSLAAREMLEVAWARTFPGAAQTRDADILRDISGEMANVDFERALEMARAIPAGEMNFQFARFGAEQGLARRLLVGPEKWHGARGYRWHHDEGEAA